MSIDQASDIVRHTLAVAFLIAAPVLLVGLMVGLLVSIFQAVTHIQEQTLVFVPKIVSMVGATVLLAPWIAAKLGEFAAAMFAATGP